MKQLSRSKNGHQYSLKPSRSLPKYQNVAKLSQNRPVFPEYKISDDESNLMYSPNEYISSENSQNTTKFGQTKLKLLQSNLSPQLTHHFVSQDQKINVNSRENQTTNQNNCNRKYSNPRKIHIIHDQIQSQNQQNVPTTKSKLPKIQHQINKKLIEKLLSVRCTVKVVSQRHLPQNTNESQTQNSKCVNGLKFRRGHSQKIESKGQRNNLNRIVQSWKKGLLEVNLEENQFKEVLKKKKMQDYVNSRPYTNREIYCKVRNEYTGGKHQENTPESMQKQISMNRILICQNQRYEDSNLKVFKLDGNMLQRRRKMRSQQQFKFNEVPLNGW